jgi:hypothetical protein
MEMTISNCDNVRINLDTRQFSANLISSTQSLKHYHQQHQKKLSDPIFDFFQNQ